jgi:hypothetical protein
MILIMTKNFTNWLIILLAVGSFSLAVVDQKYRGLFADFCQSYLAGFLALLNTNNPKQ